ncbi:hypothetical protein DFH08DRAFT_1007605 [Mycena albidolilacea]|uniref:Uncharacterized protein n=1 Tax=Mycena albidolilacea TaxID=1033008 RepID=A0AAD7ERU6_9AGAR|nr:hypothetical protein DFH08DRAFT_1007605 [Mycena albidolilacea]
MYNARYNTMKSNFTRQAKPSVIAISGAMWQTSNGDDVGGGDLRRLQWVCRAVGESGSRGRILYAITTVVTSLSGATDPGPGPGPWTSLEWQKTETETEIGPETETDRDSARGRAHKDARTVPVPQERGDRPSHQGGVEVTASETDRHRSGAVELDVDVDVSGYSSQAQPKLDVVVDAAVVIPEAESETEGRWMDGLAHIKVVVRYGAAGASGGVADRHTWNPRVSTERSLQASKHIGVGGLQ